MNTYKKYCPNVFVAQCDTEYKKGDIIILETKYGKEVENEVHNFLGKTRDGKFLYSITRTDGTTSQTRAADKASKLGGYADNADRRSTAYYEASQEGRDFLVLAEPIKVGHHSERRHRKLIERNWARMGKSVAESVKAEEYRRRAEYWEERASKIDLSMPDSLEYFEFELEKARNRHQFLKDNPDKREHSMSLQYANKVVKDLEEKVAYAIRLWGEEDEVAQLNAEKQEKAQSKVSKSAKQSNIVKEHGGFFAFNDTQFKAGYARIKDEGVITDGDKVVHVGMGLYIPKVNVESFLSDWKK